MARFTFGCIGGNTYRDDNTDFNDNSGYFQGNNDDAGVDSGDMRSIVLFDSAAIRSALANYRITGCYIDFHVLAQQGSGCDLRIGTHNYTSNPSVWDDGRVNQQRLIYRKEGTGRVTGLSLGTTIGTEFKNGVSTGISFGPAPDDEYGDYAKIAPDGATYEPVLYIDGELTNVAPNPPTLQSPAAGVVLDMSAVSVGFQWAHSDPNGDAQAAWRFRRKLPNGTFDWWNGTSFVATETELTQSNAPLTNGLMTIPAGKWQNGIAAEWSVATRDPSGAWGAYATGRILYSSAPPVAGVVEPTLRATSARPTVRWTYSDPNNEAQYAWAAQVVATDVYSSSGYNPDAYLGQAWSASGQSNATAAQVSRDLVNHKSYRAYVKVASSPNPAGGVQWSPWSYAAFDVVVPPFPPSVTYPQNGSVADLGNGFTLSWQNTFFSNVGSQTGFAIRRLVDGQGFRWWNGTAWVAAETFLAGSSASYAFRANEVPNGVTYTFTVAIRDDYNETSPYSSGSTVLASSAAQVTVLAPLGTIGLVNPTVTWSVFDIENDPQQTWQVRVIASDVFSAPGAFDPGTATAVWNSGEQPGESTRTAQVGVDLLNAQRYRAYVRVKTTGVYSGWSFGEFTVSTVPPGTPAATATVIDDQGAVEIVVQGRDSMLTTDAARSFNGWGPLDNSAVSNGVYFESARSSLAVNVRSLAAGTMSARSLQTWPVAPGQRYTAAVTIVANVGTEAVGGYASIEFLNADGAVVAVVSPQPVSDASAVRSVASGDAPDNATSARLRVTYQGVQAGNRTHTFFDPVLRPGTGGEWSPGGTVGSTFVSVAVSETGRLVRGGQRVLVPLDTQRVVVRDHEVPIGVVQHYVATTRAVYPSAVLTSERILTNAVRWSSGFMWLSDPLRPGSQRSFAPQSFGAVTRPVQQGKFRPLGRADAVITSGTRGLREGSYKIVTHSRTEREAYDSLVDNSEIILLRVPPDNADHRIADPAGETVYVRLEGDAPQVRPLSSRTPHREIEQSWTEQYAPPVNG